MANPSRKWVPRSRRATHWRRLIRAWKRSGESQAKFCRRQGISVFSFRWWKWALARARKPRRPRRPRFLPVRVVEPTAPLPVSPVEIRVRPERVIHVRPGFDRACLREVLAVLESAPC